MNTVNHNSLDGIKLHNSDHNEISENEVHYSPTGITLVSSNYNVISFNNLLNNDLCISESSDCIGNIFENNNCPTPNQPPNCIIELQKDGIEIQEINIGEFIDIFVGDSTDDIGIEQVWFSSDDLQDGVPTGEWIEYDWDITLGDWNTDTKIKQWAFSTLGKKEVWVEIKDNIGQKSNCSKNILIIPGYAIIAAGSGRIHPLTKLFYEKEQIDYGAHTAYRALRNLGFDDDHIIYLNTEGPHDVDQDGDDDVDYPAHPIFFWDALDFIKSKALLNPSITLVLYLVGHGLPSEFYFHADPEYNWKITCDDLSLKIDEFPIETPMLIKIDACYSGMFITSINGISNDDYAKRIILTSAHPDRDRPIIATIHASFNFWTNLNNGLSIKDAYVDDITRISLDPNPFDDNPYPYDDCQNLWLDDNGDRKGNPPNDLADDGLISSTTYIGIPSSDNLEFFPSKYLFIASPGELRVYDSINRITGLIDGIPVMNIPYSTYDVDNHVISILYSTDTYYYEVEGIKSGNYGLGIISVIYDATTTFTADSLPIDEKAIHQYTIDWEMLTYGDEGVTVEVDSDGDGLFEQTLIADNKLTNNEYILQTETKINFDSDTLNLKSKGKWVTVYIELPEGFEISSININSIQLIIDTYSFNVDPGSPSILGDYDNDGINDLMIKFSRKELQNILQKGENVEIIIMGRLLDGKLFTGKDTIRVISHEEIALENEESYSQTISYPSLISANTLILQLVALVGIAIILVIIPKKRIGSKF